MEKRMQDFLEDFEVSFEWIDKETVGLYDPMKNQVKINVALLVLETFMHEYMHDKYPKLNEVEIEAKARNKIKRMNVIEINELLSILWTLRRRNET